MKRMSRRSFIGSAATAAASAYALQGRTAAARRKPNLLFLWTDEQRPDTMAVYGNRRIHAPNLNKFAQECVVFEHAYDSQPVCTPARSTVMTGLWPHQNGCMQNNVALSERVKTFPELLGDSDYRTGYFGKWHLGDEVFPQHGFEEWKSIEDMYRPFFREGREADRKSDYHRWLTELGYKPDTEKGDFSRGFASHLPIEHCKPKFLELQACDFLRRHRDEPFVLYVNFLEPHMPFTGPLNDEHRLDEVELPANFNDPLEENEPAIYRLRAQLYNTTRYGESKSIDLTREEGWRRLIANYWGLVAQVDRSVGAILDTLESLGLADNTVVVYTSDHGDMMGSHHFVEKAIMYEEAMRVPWLMRVPEQGRRAQVVNGRYSQIDLVPTLLDLMGAEADLPGKSLVPAVRNGQRIDDPIFVQWNAPEKMDAGRNPAGAKRDATRHEGQSTRTVVAPDGWKLSINDGDKNQLFNLASDPGETTNVYGPGQSDTILRLARLIRAWQERVGDTFPVDDRTLALPGVSL